MGQKQLTAIPSHRYLTPTEGYELLEQWAQEAPDHCRVIDIGCSTGGLPIKVCVIAPDLKWHHKTPAIWLDGCTHATELASAMACLHSIRKLLMQEEALHNTYYICPYVSPDGAEAVLKQQMFLRSTPKPYGVKRTDRGWKWQHADRRDGVLQMRWQSEAGAWTEDPDYPGLMVPRLPGDTGPFYHMVGEGAYFGMEEETIDRDFPPPLNRMGWDLDLNRNWPFMWQVESRESGSGAYGGSEPETQAVLKFLSSHRNIFCVHTHHTSGAAHLLPTGNRLKSELDPLDRKRLRYVAEHAASMTGYRWGFLEDDLRAIDDPFLSYGVFQDFAYFSLGTLTFTTEMWMVLDHAHPERTDKNWLKNHGMLADRQGLRKIYQLVHKTDPECFRSWEPYQHPQLGPVETGGFDHLRVFRNPLPSMLEKECDKVARCNVSLQNLAPSLKCLKHTRRQIDSGTEEITLVIANTGFLSTAGMNAAKERDWFHPVTFALETPEGTKVLTNTIVSIDEIPGFENGCTFAGQADGSLVLNNSPQNVVRIQWVVYGARSATLTVQVTSQRAGCFAVTIPASTSEEKG